MKGKLMRKIQEILRGSKLQAQCLLLLSKNLLLIRMLHVKSASLLDSIVIEGIEATLFWKVQGCHRIKIEGIGIVKGNSSGIKFKVHDIHKPIQICFYGIARRKTESILFNGSKINLLNKFYSGSDLPITIGAPHNGPALESLFSFTNLVTTFESINIEFESFDNSKPQHINQS